jgi:hypothetical protein
VHLLTCSDARAKKARYEAIDDLRKEIKYHPAGRELLEAINLWTTDPSQPPTITPNRLTAHTINAALRDQTEFGWPNLF